MVDGRELADTFDAGPGSAGIEDRTLFVGLTVLVAALTKAAFVSWLAINDRHHADSINAAVVDARVVFLLAAAVSARNARPPATAVDTGLTLVAATARIRRDWPAHNKRGNH